MKNIIRSLPVKIICFVLCIVCLLSAIASVVGVVVMANIGVYTRAEEFVYTEITTNILRSDTYSIMFYAFGENIDDLGIDHYFSPLVTNLRFRVMTYEEEMICTNSYTDTQLVDWNHRYYFHINEVEGGRYIQKIDRDETAGFESSEIYVCDVYIEPSLPIKDEYFLAKVLLEIAYKLRYALFVIAGGSAILWIISFTILLCSAGRRKNSDEIHAGAVTKLPFDLVLGAITCLVIGSLYFLDAFTYNTSDDIEEFILIGVFGIAAFVSFMWICIDIAVRIKQKNLFANTLVWKICKQVARFFRWMFSVIKNIVSNLTLVPKIAILIGINTVVDFVLLIFWIDYRGYVDDFVLTFWALKSTIVSVALLYFAILMKRLQKGAKELASGNLGYRIDKKGMFGDFKLHAENLSSVSDGMLAAVEQRLKSERTKAELITNVSHDIKTPLTSIINYASLISEENCENEKHKEYSAVLVKKSVHLKRLLEDLVEISKANTGNLDVVMDYCSAQVLLSQVAGEFEQRCKDAGLDLIVRIPEENMTIMADSRRIWRIFENLMNNACKYSLSGSRVYLSLEKVESNAVFTFRNTSRYVLGVSPDELLERFVRGDESRNTEGNGLGLSIASSLTKLQNGQMDVTVDGDLFKVTLSFPTVQ